MKIEPRFALSAGILFACTTFSGCGVPHALDTSSVKEHDAVTGSAGKTEKLLPEWVPNRATAVKVLQRTTGEPHDLYL